MQDLKDTMRVSFNIEQPPSSTISLEPTEVIRRRRSCFPFEPFKCLPRFVKIWLPGTWQRIQDSTHLVLVIGMLAFIAMFVTMVVLPVYKVTIGEFQKNVLIRAGVTLLFLMTAMPYTYKLLGQYDEQLRVKKEQARLEKEKLTVAYHDLLADMDNLLAKSAESASGLAERSFESKRRDFQRFLERVKHKYTTLFVGSKTDGLSLLEQFKRFCTNWMNVFEECSIDPIKRPKRVVTAEEIIRCTSIGEVADLCLERLRCTEVRFISIQRDHDTQMVRKTRTTLQRMKSLSLDARHGDFLESGDGAPRRANLRWLTFRRGSFCCSRRLSVTSADGYPARYNVGCAQISVLSNEHMKVLLGFALGCVVFGVQCVLLGEALVPLGENPTAAQTVRHHADVVTAVTSFVEILGAVWCLAVILARFEDIDIIQQLEREVKELAQQNKQVEMQKAKMNEFWNNAQNLTELWLHRTVPRLDLFKEIHSQLEDAPAEDLLVNMSGANQWLQELEGKLGSLEAWRNDGALKLEDKKTFGAVINDLCRERDFAEVLVMLEEVTAHKMEAFLALPAPPVSALHSEKGQRVRSKSVSFADEDKDKARG